VDALVSLAAASAAFVGTHFLLSHPLRKPIVARAGEGAFTAIYGGVAAVTLAWVAVAYRATPATPPLWPVGGGIWALATVGMLIASVLLVGSLVGNPALPAPGVTLRVPPAAHGAFAVTRHPMMWAFALWGLCHIAVYPVAANMVLAGAIIVLALVGAAMQDRKKVALYPVAWRAWKARTGFWPFAAIAMGRARFGGFGTQALAGGLVIWLAASWAHIPLTGWHAGIWRWVG
jgi:uncharacterized membrane protein